MKIEARILVAAESAVDADLVKTLLRCEFENIALASGEDGAEAFGENRPNVLILAFTSLQRAEDYCLGLYRGSAIVHTLPHRTLVLCNKNDLQRAYELCRTRHFDDYMLFWPMVHDTCRLGMAVHHALWSITMEESGLPATRRLIAQAEPLLELENCLDRYATAGREHIEAAHSLLQQKRPEDCAALQPLRAWAAALKQEFAPQLQAAAALKATTQAMRPLALVVDDDEFQHRLLLKLLTDQGLDCTFASTGASALAALAKRRPDIIFMDVNLPDIGGIEITRHLRGMEDFSRIPIIMITGRSERNVVFESLQAGANDFLVKPLDSTIMKAKISSHLKRESCL